jgi:hypothetical protein
MNAAWAAGWDTPAHVGRPDRLGIVPEGSHEESADRVLARHGGLALVLPGDTIHTWTWHWNGLTTPTPGSNRWRTGPTPHT